MNKKGSWDIIDKIVGIPLMIVVVVVMVYILYEIGIAPGFWNWGEILRG